MLLVCVDGSAASRRAVEEAVTWAAALSLPVTVLYVEAHQEARALAEGLGRMREVREVLASQDAQMARFLESLEADFPGRLRFEVRQGPVVETILEAAAKARYLVMGVDGEGDALRRLLIGSVTEAVLKDAPCPVLCCRKKALL